MEVQFVLLLQALKAALKKEEVQWESRIAKEDWEKLFELAMMHNVLPMVYDAVYACKAFAKIDTELQRKYKRPVFQFVMIQVRKTEEFLGLYRFLQKKGLSPILVKGLICRELYPQSDYRMSGDEDLLIRDEEFQQYHEALTEFGMEVTTPEQEASQVFEVTYVKKGSALHIELHKELFAPEGEAYSELNQYFENVHDEAILQEIQGVKIRTLNYTDHLFYLIAHSFKHFLHSGFGIRQVCDIVMFANTYGHRVNWEELLKRCEEIHAKYFAAALFKIGRRYLVFSHKESRYPQSWKEIQVDEEALLNDLLVAGIYGGADMSRKHSSNITLNAVIAHKQGKGTNGSILKTIFPPAKNLEASYHYLKKYPVLLPAAWIQRLVRYQKETRMDRHNNALESIAIGNSRIELLKQYHIIDS